MSIDELLDAHQARLANDPGYIEIWNKVQAAKPEHRLLLAMQLWGQNAAALRSLVAECAIANEAVDFMRWLLEVVKDEHGMTTQEVHDWFRKERT